VKDIQLKGEKEREAGNQLPVIDFDTETEARDHAEEAVSVKKMDASEDPVEEP
jgi:hypothetical protein